MGKSSAGGAEHLGVDPCQIGGGNYDSGEKEGGLFATSTVEWWGKFTKRKGVKAKLWVFCVSSHLPMCLLALIAH